RRPDTAQHFHVLVRARVAFVMRKQVAILPLVVIVSARDHVQREAAATELIQGRELARRQRRCDETRPMREHQAELFGHRSDVGPDHKAIGAVAEISDQDAVEAALLMGLREAADVVHIDGGSLGRMNFRGGLGADHADEFDAHRTSLSGGVISASLVRTQNNPVNQSTYQNKYTLRRFVASNRWLRSSATAINRRRRDPTSD